MNMPPKTFTTRSAVTEDHQRINTSIAGIAAAGHKISNSFDLDWYLNHYQHRLEHAHLKAVAEDQDGNIIGAVMVEPLQPSYAAKLAVEYNTQAALAVELGGMFVHPDYRGQGIAKQLVATIADLAEPHGFTVICAIEPGNPASNGSIGAVYTLTPIVEHTFNGVDLVNYLLTRR